MTDKNIFRIFVDTLWLEDESHPFKAVGFCQNRNFTFYTSGFGTTWWFEASVNPFRDRREVFNGDVDYYCVTNEKENNETKYTVEDCKKILMTCCKKFSEHISKINIGNCNIEREPVLPDHPSPPANF